MRYSMLPPDGPQQMGTCSITFEVSNDGGFAGPQYGARCSVHDQGRTSGGITELDRWVAEHVEEHTPAPAEPDRKARLVHLAGALGLDESVGVLMDGVVAEILRALDERAAVEPTRDESTLTDSGQSEPLSTECRYCGADIRMTIEGAWLHLSDGRASCGLRYSPTATAEPTKNWYELHPELYAERCGKLAEDGRGQTAACTFDAGHPGVCSWWNR